MNNRLFIPEDVGTTPEQLGPDAENKYPCVLATDRIFEVRRTREPIPPEVLELSMFGFPVQDERILLFADTNTYGIDGNKWVIDTSLTDEQFITPSVSLWSQLPLGVGLTASYGGIDAYATYSDSAINLIIPSGINAESKFINCVSKQLFSCDVGSNLFISFGLKITKSAGIKKAGLFSSASGWYLEVEDNGSGDKLRIVRRYLDESGATREVRYSRSHPVFFDKLDGTGASQLNLSLDLVVMVGLELGSYDGSAVKFYVYAADILQGGSHRWIMFANIPTSDDNFLPERISTALPITFESFSNSFSTTEVLSKYGTSAIKLGVDSSPLGIFSQTSQTVELIPGKEILVMGLLTKDIVNNKPCKIQQYLKYINLNSSVPAELVLRRFLVTPSNARTLNLTITPSFTLDQSGLDAIAAGTSERLGDAFLSIIFSGGKQVNTTKVFQEYREFFSSSFASFGTNTTEPISQDLILFYIKNLGEILSSLDEQIDWVDGLTNNPVNAIASSYLSTIPTRSVVTTQAIASVSVITSKY